MAIGTDRQGRLQLVQTLVGFVVVVLIIAAAVLLAWLLMNSESQLAVGLAAAALTVVGSLATVLLTKWQERRTQVQLALRDKKVPMYEQLITLVFDALLGGKRGKKMTEAEMAKRLADLTPGLVVWGAADVVKAYATFRRLSAQPGAAEKGAAVMLSVEQIFRMIRKDLGHDDSILNDGDILAFFINDIDEHLARR